MKQSTDLNLNNRTELFNIADPVEECESIDYILRAMKYVIKTSKIKVLGLAAPQIGVSKRIIILLRGNNWQVIINPKLTNRSLSIRTSREMCLSFPGLVGKKKRFKRVFVEGFDENWKPLKIKATGLDSCVIQHEIDHLNGKTIK